MLVGPKHTIRTHSTLEKELETAVLRTSTAFVFRGLLVVGLLFVATSNATAQEKFAEAEGPYTSIEGFRGLDWGTSEGDVIARLGEPTERRRLDDGLEILAYRNTLVGHPSIVLLGLLDEQGFVKAQEVSNLAGNDDEKCIEQVRDIHREINLRYPLIRPAEEAKNNTPEPICSAAPAGEAYWHRQWRDETTGAAITVSVKSGSDKVEVTYESKAFIDWVGSEGDGARPEIEDEGAPAEMLEGRP